MEWNLQSSMVDRYTHKSNKEKTNNTIIVLTKGTTECHNRSKILSEYWDKWDLVRLVRSAKIL